MNNNIANFKGKIITVPKFTHSVMNENFYEFTLEVKRQSGISDFIPVTMNERLGKFDVEQFVEIKGSIRTFNKFDNEKSRLIITVFAKELKVLECEQYENSVELQGFLCKQPVLRKTALTNLDIADCLIATNNKYGKSYYIPTISFNRDATFVSQLPVGMEISVRGRLQSRLYTKEINGEKFEMTAYEVCIKNLSKFDKGE